MDMYLRFMRYGFVGVATNAAGYMLYLLITWLGIGPKTAMSLLYCVGATMGYFGHRRFAFNFEGGYLASAMRYALVHCAGYALNFALLFILVDQLQYPHELVQAASIFIVAGFLFLCFNFFVFP